MIPAVEWLQVPSDGEFPIMNYRIMQEFKPPFKVYPTIEEKGPLKVLFGLDRCSQFVCLISLMFRNFDLG